MTVAIKPNPYANPYSNPLKTKEGQEGSASVGSLVNPAGPSDSSSVGSKGFLDMLKEGVHAVNQSVQAGDRAGLDLITGRSSNLHETMLAVARAEIGFNTLVQLRNKSIEAYQEVMRMQV